MRVATQAPSKLAGSGFTAPAIPNNIHHTRFARQTLRGLTEPRGVVPETTRGHAIEITCAVSISHCDGFCARAREAESMRTRWLCAAYTASSLLARAPLGHRFEPWRTRYWRVGGLSRWR